MRFYALWVGVLFLSAAYAGCLGGDEGAGDEAVPDSERITPQQRDPDDEGASEESDDEAPGRSDGDAPSTGPRRISPGPMVVVAHIDTGVNPYHIAFRDDSRFAYVHPSEYIPGYPADTPALELTLDADSYEKALEADADVWERVEEDELYWIPGTKIIGAISFGPGGTNCPPVDKPPFSYVSGDCPDTPILDDHGHGTMTASRSTGNLYSLAPSARLVTVENPSGAAVRWVADQGWIDVQTNSWGSLVAHPVDGASGSDIAESFRYAAERMVTVEATGNGAGGFFGFAPCSTYTWAQGPPGVILVGAHDNGYVTAWSCSPPHVVTDGFRPWSALRASLDTYETTGFACCTSTSAPYAAGGAAAIILQARTILGDSTVGVAKGILAEGRENLVPDGPLADGNLTMDELRELLFKTAQARPVATEDDGEAHWLSSPGTVPRDPTNPGDNAYCPGCWTTFVPYSQIPPDVPAYFYTGYGALNVYSAQAAYDVLLGNVAMPERSVEDDAYALDQQLRDQIFG